MSKVSEKVLKSIKIKGIRPTSRAYFVLREVIFWFLYVTILFLSSLLFAAILELLLGRNFAIPPMAVIWGKILGEIPAHWFIALLFFLFAGLYVNRRTRGSYRLRKRIILAGEILGVFLLGTIFYFLEAGLFACEVLGK